MMPTATMAEQMASMGQVVLEMEPRKSLMKNDQGRYAGDWVDQYPGEPDRPEFACIASP